MTRTGEGGRVRRSPRRKVLKAEKIFGALLWWRFELSCGHILKEKCPTDRTRAAKTMSCYECARGHCKTGEHHIVDAAGPESAAWKCTKCSYSSDG
jgi:hypothetical protein